MFFLNKLSKSKQLLAQKRRKEKQYFKNMASINVTGILTIDP